MRVCPRCLTRYGEGSRYCDLDGAALEEADISGEDVLFSAATSAESPSGRRQSDLAAVPSLPGPTTVIDGGTRVSVADARPQPPRPPPKRRSRSRELAEQRVGEVLGSYKLLAVLGTGGMGAVYRAEHIKLGRPVALKLLHQQFARRRDALARFFQEAQAVNRIRHKNIVDVTDLVERPDGTAFIIMELLDGVSLGEHLNTTGLLDTPSALSLLLQICDALAAAHEADIVHRDLKPDNIFLSHTEEGALLVKLLDFGVAKLINPESEVGHRTAAGSVVGTPAFMSPEQAAGLEIDQRSDLYSLGAIMYQLFTGQPVFAGRSFSELVNKHLSVEPAPPRQTPGGIKIAPELEAIIMRCLQKSPEARFQTALELRAALRGFFDALASELGTEVESTSGIYQLPDYRPPDYGPPPETISGPNEQAYETALAAGDLDPNWRTSVTGGSRLPLFIAVAVALVATLVAIGVVSELGGEGELQSQPASEPAGQPTPEAVVTPLAPADASSKIVMVRLRSRPPAEVFLRGDSRPECESTPCDFPIDPRDGGSPDRRVLVLRADGYRDATVEVLLKDPEPIYRATLTPLPPAPDAGALPATGKKTAGRKKAGGRKKTGQTSSGDKKTGGGKKTGSGPVDPGETLDPFSRGKSK